MNRLFIALLLLIFFTGCTKNCIENNSECLQSKIEEFKFKAICTDGASIKEYTFQDKTVYVFDQSQCMADGWSDIWDKDCNFLGMLGGIAGFSKIKMLLFTIMQSTNKPSGIIESLVIGKLRLCV